MKAEDLYEAMQSVRPEFLEECEMYSPKRNVRRVLFIAAAIALSSICAAAAVWSLREKAKADIGITQPISGWSEYDETEPEGLGRKNEDELKKTVTLDSSLCAGDQLDAYLRVHGVQPEAGASLEAKDEQYQWDLSDLDYHSSCSIDIQHIAYEKDSQTALVRLHLGGLENVEQVAVTLALRRDGETVVCCNPVDIPITSADTLHAKIDCALPRDNWMGEMRAVNVQVFRVMLRWSLRSRPLQKSARRRNWPRTGTRCLSRIPASWIPAPEMRWPMRRCNIGMGAVRRSCKCPLIMAEGGTAVMAAVRRRNCTRRIM